MMRWTGHAAYMCYMINIFLIKEVGKEGLADLSVETKII
jgi:hypothetical protein